MRPRRRFFLRVYSVSGQAHRFPKLITQAIAGLVVGLMMGLAIGWWLWPVRYTNTSPSVLRQDYRDDYTLMVATTYEVEQDPERAYERMSLLNPQDPAAPIIELAERLLEAGGSTEDVTRLARLARALGTVPPTLVPYLEGQP
jgi:hypothetical protein